MTDPANFDGVAPGDPPTARPRAEVSSPPPPSSTESMLTSALPSQSVADGVEHPLDPRYLVLQRRRGWVNAVVYSALWFAAGMAGSTMFFRSLDMDTAPENAQRALLALWAVSSIAYAVWCQRRPAIAYRHASYRLDARGIEIRGGVLWRRVINVPRSRVQHIDVSQGPFERRHGIGTLSIYTAGVSHAMVSLPGLEHGRALRIRDYLLPHEDNAGL